ncbi:MAG: hypothetical protein MK207_05695 [Saprospiraceae bacterium]|nr:hypothetical protein [Saprospiraceae bacterium]
MNNINYILVGTYKTKPENKGWYVNDYRYSILWEKINNKFDSKCSHADCEYNTEQSIFGTVNGLNNFFFYDLKTFDYNLKGETKDIKVFKNNREDFIWGIEQLITEVQSRPKEVFRIGLQGNNTVGLFLNYFNRKERLQKVSLVSLAKDWRHLNFGSIKAIKNCPLNLKVYKIYNLTQPARKKEDLNNLFHRTWNDFLNLKN